MDKGGYYRNGISVGRFRPLEGSNESQKHPGGIRDGMLHGSTVQEAVARLQGNLREGSVGTKCSMEGLMANVML